MSLSLLCSAFMLLMTAVRAEKYDLIIHNGRILDGTGAAAWTGDVGIRAGRIATIGKLGSGASAETTIEANGRYIAPGFIDAHTHCEDDLLSMPLAENFIRMGVTTVVTGNCGGSYKDLEEAFTSHTQMRLGPNMASLVGHNTVRRQVMGNENRDPSTTEIRKMISLVGKAMSDGAVGMSTGLIYTPGVYSKTEEIQQLAREAGRYGGLYVSHMRSEGTSIPDAIEEALAIGKYANCPVQISHFKITSPKRHGESTRTIQMVEDARKNGQDVTVDQYVYTASSTSISTLLPNWAVEGTTTDVKNRLLDPSTRAKIMKEFVEDRRDSGRANMDYAKVASFKADRSAEGKSIYELAKEWKKAETWEAQGQVIADIMTSGGAGMVFHSMAEEDVRNIVAYPNTMFASDSGVREFGKSKPHPRGYGNNARVLANYVRVLKLLSVEEAVRKMTSLPAWRFGLHDRGVIREGAAADLVIFDLQKVKDLSTFEQPHAYSEGFDDVIINGQPVILNKEWTGQLPGQVLYGPGKGKNPVAKHMSKARSKVAKVFRKVGRSLTLANR